jgi:hypothetical protein
VTPDELATTTTGFASLKLGLDLYEWQARALLPIELYGQTGKRQNVAIVTPNGSGKDERIIPSAVYYWLFFNPRGRVVITSKSDLQLTSQTIPNLNKHYRKFGWGEPVNSPRYTLTTPTPPGYGTGGSLIAYVTNDGARSEGHHERPGEPLLMIINEAKSIDASIWEGIDRCTPSVLMLISSPGLRQGRFYDCFNGPLSPLYHKVRAGLKDCPHIPKEKIDHVIAEYGENHPVVRSMIFGEFMEQDGDEVYCATDTDIENCINSPPQHRPGFRFGFFDFGQGSAENVFVTRNGNKFEITDKWREVNEDAIVGRAITLMRQEGLTAEQCAGDAAAKGILDKLALAGWPIGRQNFGAPEPTGVYKSWSAMAWIEGCNRIKRREVILPNDDLLKSQIVARKKQFTITGKLAVEEKYQMSKRGIPSPDRGDALFGCMSAIDVSIYDAPRASWDEYVGEQHSTFSSVGY